MSIPPLEDPALSFIKLPRIRMGDAVLERYQNKLLEIRKKYREEAKTNARFSFYQGECDEDEDKETTAQNMRPPSDNIFAYFLFFPSSQSNESNDWYLYWNPNLECEGNLNLDWNMSSAIYYFIFSLHTGLSAKIEFFKNR